MSWRIAWESAGTAIIPIFLFTFKFFRYLTGYDTGNAGALGFIESILRNLLLIYYFYTSSHL